MPLKVLVSTAAENELMNGRELDASDTVLMSCKHYMNIADNQTSSADHLASRSLKQCRHSMLTLDTAYQAKSKQ